MRSILLFYCLFTLLVLNYSCKSDSVTTFESDIEEIYFLDYDSPREKWGYINVNGKEVIPAIYDDLRDMTSHITAANLKGRWGFIDHKGDTKIDFTYKQVLDFSENRTFVENFKGDWLLIDNKGRTIDTLEFNKFSSFKDGKCAVAWNSMWGLIDDSADVLIEPEYELLKSLNSELWIAKRFGKYGLINSNNEVILDFKFLRIAESGDTDIFKAKTKEGYNLYRIGSTKPLLSTHQKISKIYNGKLITKNAKSWDLLDADNGFQIIKSLNFDKVDFGGEGYWRFKVDGKWGLLDLQGNEIIPAKYDVLNRVQEGKIVVGNNDQWGYIDTQGNEVIPMILPLAWDFKNGYARILAGRGCGFINTQGSFVIEDKYFEVRDFYNGLARFQER